MTRTAYFISDGTGITAEALGQSLLAQFDTIGFTKLTRPYVDSVETVSYTHLTLPTKRIV